MRWIVILWPGLKVNLVLHVLRMSNYLQHTIVTMARSLDFDRARHPGNRNCWLDNKQGFIQ